jgi:hypothetical protein
MVSATPSAQDGSYQVILVGDYGGLVKMTSADLLVSSIPPCVTPTLKSANITGPSSISGYDTFYVHVDYGQRYNITPPSDINTPSGYALSGLGLFSCQSNPTWEGSSSVAKFTCVAPSYNSYGTNRDNMYMMYAGTINNPPPGTNLCGGLGSSFATITVNPNPPAVPYASAATITPKPIVPDDNTQYDIKATGVDMDGGNLITYQYALINRDGTNTGAYRGYLGWKQNFSDTFPYTVPESISSVISCNGGGYAAQIGDSIGTYGNQYLTLLGCSTFTTLNSRQTTYTVKFKPTFTTPTTNNTISSWVADASISGASWAQNLDSFDLSMPNTVTINSNASVSGGYIKSGETPTPYIDCGNGRPNRCSHSYPPNTPVTLTEYPNSIHWLFLGWTSNPDTPTCNGGLTNRSSNTCSFTVTRSTSVTVKFTPIGVYSEF